ncbi:epidermal growth factor receptor kinase substrate 8-like protein 2 isoform X1 [Planococcus citri]|uniref:epidermal growth factor receptor kinase substrate 8-like protein 2 isoform X1 n=1 Tax=Planococcus citri TaxID=170843 RepID=UPI0031F99A39
MPYSRSSVHSNGYSPESHQSNESPTYVMEHLATFSVAKETGIVYPADGMRRLLQLEKSNGIWSQKMHFRMDPNWVLIMDYETGVVMEKFPVSVIQEPTAFTSNDPMEIYNNILVFIVGDERQLSGSQSEMHIFQCQSISAQDLVEDLKLLRSGHILPSHPKPRHSIPPPPPTPPPEPPLNGMKVRDQVSVFNAAAAHPHSVEPGRGGSSEFEGREDETSSTSSEKYERDVTVLNHCFDDIEKFIARLQHAAAASRELERRQKSRKSKKKDLGDGMLTMRAKPPPEIEFIDIFQKFKLSFNLLAKLKSHIHDPNAPELVHFLFTPLALIVDASHDTHYGPNLPASVVTPLLTKEAVNLLMHCVTSKETELWHSLGDAWLVPREQWKGNVPPYHPIFMDGWSPDYPVSDNRGSTPSEQIPLSGDKRGRDEPRSHREVHADLREAQYGRNLDHGHDDSSDYFDYEQQGSDMVPPAAPPLPLVGQYPYEAHSRRYSRDEREICHSPDAGSDPEFASMMPSHVHNVPRDRDMGAHSDISADSIERNGGLGERFERNQMRWLDELRNRDAKIVQVTYPRTANNDKELTVVRGEFLEVLDDSRKWWKTRNSRGVVAHVPHTIVTPFSSVTDSSEVFNNPVYGRGYDRGGRPYMTKESMSSIERDHVGPSSESPRGTKSPVQAGVPAPAEWVRKERLGKKGEFRYF